MHFQNSGISFKYTFCYRVEDMVDFATKKYHNSESIISDELYDLLFDYLKEKPTSN